MLQKITKFYIKIIFHRFISIKQLIRESKSQKKCGKNCRILIYLLKNTLQVDKLIL